VKNVSSKALAAGIRGLSYSQIFKQDSIQIERSSSVVTRASSNTMEQLHHDLKAREEDLLFLKKRILFPGIFEQESSDEDAPSNRRFIRQQCKQK
jgi:hypothetical protein